MGKFFNNITSEELTKEAKRSTILRNIVKGTLRKIPGAGYVEKNVVKPAVAKALTTKPGQGVRKAFHWIDDPKKFKTTNRKSDFYVKPANRNLVYKSGKVLGAIPRHPIRTGIAAGTYALLSHQAAEADWRRKAYDFYDQKGSDLQSNTWTNVKEQNYTRPNTAMFNATNATAFTDKEISTGMDAMFAGSNLVNLSKSGYTWDDMGLPVDSLGNKFPADNVQVLVNNYNAMMNDNPGLFDYNTHNQYFNTAVTPADVRGQYHKIQTNEDDPNPNKRPTTHIKNKNKNK